MPQHWNVLTDPWVDVIDARASIQTLSPLQILENAPTLNQFNDACIQQLQHKLEIDTFNQRIVFACPEIQSSQAWSLYAEYGLHAREVQRNIPRRNIR